MLDSFLHCELPGTNDAVRSWRARVRAGTRFPPERRSAINDHRLPVLATLGYGALPRG
jgi:hypothetical protein